MKTLIFPLLLCLFVGNAGAAQTYQEPAEFIAESFAGDTPEPEVLWLDKAMKSEMGKIMSRRWRGLRVRYWRRDDHTVWILEEIGKEKPITFGTSIRAGKIERMRVLVFRESRGWEVRYPAFTAQFDNAALTPKRKLDRKIDGVSGATLSVRAMKKIARLSLYLHDHIMQQDESA